LPRDWIVLSVVRLDLSPSRTLAHLLLSVRRLRTVRARPTLLDQAIAGLTLLRKFLDSCAASLMRRSRLFDGILAALVRVATTPRATAVIDF
jgi:hypothetical protein